MDSRKQIAGPGGCLRSGNSFVEPPALTQGGSKVRGIATPSSARPKFRRPQITVASVLPHSVVTGTCSPVTTFLTLWTPLKLTTAVCVSPQLVRIAVIPEAPVNPRKSRWSEPCFNWMGMAERSVERGLENPLVDDGVAAAQIRERDRGGVVDDLALAEGVLDLEGVAVGIALDHVGALDFKRQLPQFAA